MRKLGIGFAIALVGWTVIVAAWWALNVAGIDEGGDEGLGATITIGIWIAGAAIGVVAASVIAVVIAVVRFLSPRGQAEPTVGPD